MNRRRVGEDRGSKEMDGCPLTADVVVIDLLDQQGKGGESFYS
jgi:hypothetical protein